MDGGSGRDVLQVGLRHAPIPSPAQAKGAYSLGERPFDAGPPLLALDALFTGIPGPGRCECLILVAGLQPHLAALLLGLGT
jgi:hypothetical protein